MLEIFAVIFSLICVYLTTQNNIWAWPYGIVGVILYGILFWKIHLFAEVILQIIFFGQSLYGWYNWAHIREKLAAPIKSLSKKQYVIYGIVFLTSVAILYFPLSMYTVASIPLLDSITTSISLIANWLLARRYIESWHLWIFVDVLYVGMFAFKGLILTPILYLVFFGMAIYGLINWKKEYKK